MSREPPSFDLVVATVDRAEELGRFLDSLEAQRYPRARVIVVDQGDDDAAGAALEGRSLEIIRLRSQRGLSRARNEALPHLRADLVAFPDDDCTYPEGLLERVAARFSADRGLDGLTGRAEDDSGRSASSWKADRAVLTDDNLWNRANAATIFLGSGVVRRTGAFDERLGLGSGEACSSAEEIDYLIRAIRAGARIEYDPSLVVLHDVRTQDERLGYRDGASIGYVLRKHAYPRRVVARMLVRPLGGTLVALARLDPALARYRLATLRGRIRGLRAWERAL